MFKLKYTAVVAAPLFLLGCTDGDDVAGYNELIATFCNPSVSTYDEYECIKAEHWERLSQLRSLQEQKDVLFTNASIPQEVKDEVEALEDEAIVVLRTYTDAIVAGTEPDSALVIAAQQALLALQQRLLEIAQEVE